jgi:predicted dienelactone hydrolase
MSRTTTARRRLLATAAALAVLVGACSSGGDDASTGGDANPGGATEAVATDYSAFGPYEVGRTTLDLDGVEVTVLYPVTTEGAAQGTAVTSISSAVAFPEAFREVVVEAAPFLVQELPVDLYDDAPVADDGPFPVLLYSHGAGGHPSFYINTMAHSASWGYVVAAPDHPSRNLAAGVGAVPDELTSTDTEDLVATVEALNAANADSSDLLYEAVDTAQLAAAGHSAGGGASARLALEGEVAGSRLATIIGQAPSPPVSLSAVIGDADATEEERNATLAAALGELTPPDLPVLLVAGERDAVIPLGRIQATYDWLGTPKQLVVLANAGHNPVLDVCAPIREQGGLVALAGGLADAFGPGVAGLLARGEDGCVEGYLDPQAGFDVTRHLTVAQLRWVFGTDPTRASLEPAFLTATFGDAIGPVEQDI